MDSDRVVFLGGQMQAGFSRAAKYAAFAGVIGAACPVVAASDFEIAPLETGGMSIQIYTHKASTHRYPAISIYGDEPIANPRTSNSADADFGLLCGNPFLYAAIDDIRPGYRGSVCGTHSVCYRVVADRVEIMVVLDKQDIEKHL